MQSLCFLSCIRLTNNSIATDNLFRDFATLLSAGIPALDAAQKLAISYPQVKNWSKVIISLQKGSRLSVSLAKSHLINRFETELIAISEDAGKLESGLQQLADHQQKRLERSSRLRAKLLYPLSILVVGILVSSLLSMLQNEKQSILQAGLWLVIKLGLSYWLFKYLIGLTSKGADHWLSRLDNYQSQSWYQLHFQNLLFQVYYWHISAAIAPQTSFSRLSKLLDSVSLKRKLLKVSSLCGQGISISNAFRQVQLPISNDALQVFSAGEHAGDIEGTLKRQTELFKVESELALDNLQEWIPRIFFVSVAAFAVLAII
jgi:type II secretory pathway component PulF